MNQDVKVRRVRASLPGSLVVIERYGSKIYLNAGEAKKVRDQLDKALTRTTRKK